MVSLENDQKGLGFPTPAENVFSQLLEKVQVVSFGTAFMDSAMRLRGISTSNTVTLTC